MSNEDFEIKSPMDAIFDLPQEKFTALLRGYGPRRGNLERLLRYWRPIMKKPGGFTRCRVILANHPNLYPLERICAWLHHETTGKWPNEGCHHPGMKNCKGKLRKLGWNDRQFSRVLKRKLRNTGKKDIFGYSDDVFFYEPVNPIDVKSEQTYVVAESDITHAISVLNDFMEMEQKFVDFLRDEKNWEIEGEDEEGKTVSFDVPEGRKSAECCGGDYE